MNIGIGPINFFVKRVLRVIFLPLGIITLLAVQLSACGSPTPEARLETAGNQLSESASDLESLNLQIEDTESLLHSLRDDRRKLRDKVRTLEQRLEVRATDVAVFRAVQTAILQDAALQEAAIAVNVDEGAVTLSGMVSSQELIQRAVATARETAGVNRVSSRIQVDDPAVR